MNDDKKIASDALTRKVQFSQKELEMLKAVSKHDKRPEEDQIRWLVEQYALGNLKFIDDGIRPKLPTAEGGIRVRYPDEVSGGNPPPDGIK